METHIHIDNLLWYIRKRKSAQYQLYSLNSDRVVHIRK